MKKVMNSKITLFILSMVLVAAMALTFVGCEKDEGRDIIDPVEKTFTFVVTELDGSKEEFTITSTDEMVGEALIKEELVDGNYGQYGLEVHTVNGQKYEYNADGVYWAFFIDGEFAMTGVDSTPITDGTVYSFTATEA